MKQWLFAAPLAGLSLVANADLLLTGIFDGDLSGGLPKGVEIYVTEDIPDLSIYGLGSANNGGDTDGQEFTFDSISADAGTYIYVITDRDGFDTWFGSEIPADAIIFDGVGAASINGDDAIELFLNGEVHDLYGIQTVNGDNEVWDYTDSWAYRNTDSSANLGTFDASEWTFAGRSAWDGASSNATSDSVMPIASFSGTGGGDNGGGDNGGGDNGGGEEPEPTPTIGACFDSATLISAVQGEGESVAIDGTVVVEGIVTGFFDNGFFIQEEPSASDNNANTSEGIFVFGDPAESLEVGDVARVLGETGEFFGNSQVSESEVLDCGPSAESIVAVGIPLPYEGIFDLETIEGMVGSVSNAAIVDLNEFTEFGEMVVSDDVQRQPADIAIPLSTEFEAASAEIGTSLLIIEDDNGNRFPDTISYYSTPEFDGLDYINAPRIGETVSATGPVRFAFGDYRVIPTQDTFTIQGSRTLAPDVSPGDVSIATFNVLNYFNGEVQEDGTVTFDYPENRGARSEEEFALQQARIIDALITLDADVVGLIEIENDGFGFDSAIRQLVNELNNTLGRREYRYAWSFDESVTGTDAISNAVIYRRAVVTPVGLLQGVDLPIQVNGERLVGQRNALVQTFRHRRTGDRFAIAVNHFKSKGSTCFEDDNEPTILDSIQGSCNNLRVSAAITLGNALEAMNLPEKTLIMGDLNSYSEEDPIAVLTDYNPETRGYTINTAVNTEMDEGLSVPVTESFGYVSVSEIFDPEGFSYYFFGNNQIGSLDHVLASPEAVDAIVDLDHWNINALELFQIQYFNALRFYNGANGDLIDFTAVGPYRSSDHDPVIVTMDMEPPRRRGLRFIKRLKRKFIRYSRGF